MFAASATQPALAKSLDATLKAQQEHIGSALSSFERQRTARSMLRHYIAACPLTGVSMAAQVALKMPPLQIALLELEEKFNSGHGNRAWIRAQVLELRGAVEAEANPLLRTEYLRRLGMMQGI